MNNNDIETPYFLINRDLLQQNTDTFIEGMQCNWERVKLSYSVKTNSLPWILRFMNQKGVMAEVVSDEEYDLAIMCDFNPENIVFNGPIKGKEHLEFALKNNSYVNIDSESDLDVIQSCNIYSNRIGIRLNIPPALFSSKDIEYTEDGFRFGFSVENGSFERALKKIKNQCDIKKIGVHLHCNSITRSLNVYRAIAEYVVAVVDKYKIEPCYLDFGGGFFGGVPGKTTPSEYFNVITSIIKRTPRLRNTLLLAEPGSALIGSTVELHTTVVDVKDTNCSRIITTDGSRIHIDPLWIKNGYLYSISYKDGEKRKYEEKQIICGYTCMDHDRLMVLMNEPELKAGDKIIYQRVGAYSMTFGGPFIRYLPDVYVDSNNELQLVRRRMKTEEYYRINTAQSMQ